MSFIWTHKFGCNRESLWEHPGFMTDKTQHAMWAVLKMIFTLMWVLRLGGNLTLWTCSLTRYTTVLKHAIPHHQMPPGWKKTTSTFEKYRLWMLRRNFFIASRHFGQCFKFYQVLTKESFLIRKHMDNKNPMQVTNAKILWCHSTTKRLSRDNVMKKRNL